MMDALKVIWDTLTMPTMMPFSVLMAFTMLYWLTVIIGALDIDLLDFDLDGDVDADVDMDGDFDLSHDGIDVHHDGAAESLAGSSEGFFHAILRFLNVGQVPVTVVLSVLFTAMFVVAYIWHRLFSGWMLATLPMALFAVITVIGVAFIGLMSTGFLTRPMRKLFIVHTQHGHEYLIGKTCKVRTSRVTDAIGQAELTQGNASLVIDVRCEGENSLHKDSEAVIVDYVKDRNFYYVKPI